MIRIALAVLVSVVPAMAEADTIGKWCGHAPGTVYSFDSVITIEATGPSIVIIESKFRSGKPYTREASRIDDSTFLQDNGDGYRILSDGSLEIFDDIGTISIARPWGNDRSDTDCWR